jgi:hypothetical protein
MDLLGGNNNNHKSDNVKNDRIKAKAAIPAARAIVTAALLLSGLSLISSFQQQPAIAQQDQNMTGGAGNATNATMTGAGNATNATMTGAGNATNATTTGAGNATNATMTGTNGSAPVNSSPSAESLTGGTTTGGGATAGGGEASGGVTNTPGGAAGPQVSP